MTGIDEGWCQFTPGPIPLSRVCGLASIVDSLGAIRVVLGGEGKGDLPWFRTNPGLFEMK